MTKNTIGSLFFLAFSTFYFYSVFGIKKMPGSQFEIMTAQTFPFYIGIAGILVSIVLLIISFIEKRKSCFIIAIYKITRFKNNFLFYYRNACLRVYYETTWIYDCYNYIFSGRFFNFKRKKYQKDITDFNGSIYRFLFITK